MRAVTSLFLLGLSSFFSCTLGPKNETPQLSLPTTYADNLVLAQEKSQEIVVLSDWWSQFDDPLLEEFIAIAAERNFDVRAALEYINQTRAGISSATAALLPKVNLFGVGARIKPSRELSAALVPPISTPPDTVVAPTTGFAPNIRNFFISGFDASWEIDFFGKNLSGKKQAEFSAKAAIENAKYTAIIITAEVVRIYTDIRSLQQRLFITEEKIKVFETLLSLTQELAECGLDSAIDIESMIVTLNDAKSQKPVLEQNLEEESHNLAFLLGGEPKQYTELLAKKSRIPQAIGKIPLGIPSDLLKRRPDIKEAEYNFYASNAGIGQAKAGLFPSFALTGLLGDASRKFPGLFNSKNKYWLAFPSIDWALFQGGKVLASIQAANANQKLAAIQYEKTVLSALKEVENSLSGYTGQSLRAADLLLEGKAQKNKLLLSKNLFDAGLIDRLALLQVYEQLFDIQEKYVDVKQQAMNYLIALYKSLGGEWDS